MKSAMWMVVAVLTMAIGCSDDGVYTPIEQPEPPPEVACDDKAGCPDASDEMDAGEDVVVFPDAQK
jgi:hypothetical protein